VPDRIEHAMSAGSPAAVLLYTLAPDTLAPERRRRKAAKAFLDPAFAYGARHAVSTAASTGFELNPQQLEGTRAMTLWGRRPEGSADSDLKRTHPRGSAEAVT